MTNEFKIKRDGDVYRWTRTYGDTTWTSRSAWLSDVEAATAAYKVASCYQQSILRIDDVLAQAMDVWRQVTRYAATVPMKVVNQ